MDPSRHAEMKKIFLEVCDLPEDERRARLDQACTGKPGLREEVEALLACDNPEEPITARNLAPAPVDAPPASDSTVLGAIRATQDRPPWWRRVAWKRLAILSLLLAAIAGGWWKAHTSLKTHLLELRGQKLQSILETTGRTLEIWIEVHLNRVEALARDREVRTRIEGFARLNLKRPENIAVLRESPDQEFIQDRIEPLLAEGGFEILSPEGYVLSCDSGQIIGKRIRVAWMDDLERILREGPMLLTTFRSSEALEETPTATGSRLIAFLAPLHDESGDVIAVSTSSLQDRDFQRIVTSGNFGQSGETYAFDPGGLILTDLRSTPTLDTLELLPADEPGRSSLNWRMRDPGGNLATGFEPAENQENQPPTRAAIEATAALDERNTSEPRSGLILEPYRNPLGKPVIGAWMTIPQFGKPFGLCTEVEVAEALQPLQILDLSAGAFLGLFLTATVIGFYTSRRKTFRRLKASDRTGQYTLTRKIGEGGLGEVFLATHSLLKRPTAVKILKPDVADDDSARRFEREVQQVSRLTHPNTIEIYDFGRTEEGMFFYVMEYLNGLNLAEVVRLDRGPLDVARTIFILRQVCASLREAHAIGLVHRDIKPVNIMLCRRGGLHDVVKVLDFGLVKQIEADPWTAELTRPNQVTGTLNYLAPERIRNPRIADHRTDLYAVGAVAWFLLTGANPFATETDLDGINRILNEDLEPLATASPIAADIPEALTDLITRCLAKDMDQRPAGADEMIRGLEEISVSHPWSEEDAEEWWEGFSESDGRSQ